MDFYCLFRKGNPDDGSFRSFNEYFQVFTNENKEYRGHAETVNKDILDSLCRRYEQSFKNITLVFIYGNGKVYFTNPFLFLKFAKKHNLIRSRIKEDYKRTLNGRQTVHEITYHLPLKFLINFDNFG